MRKKFPRCSGACHDGTQCGRRVTDGSQPPLCHLHDGREHPSPIIPPSDEIDEIKILKRLARDPNPQVRLRAVDLLLSLKEKEPKKDRRSDSIDLERLTDEERTRFITLADQYKDLRARIAARLDPVPEPVSAPVAAAPIEESPVEPVEPRPIVAAPIEEPIEPTWTPARYEAAGFIKGKTHPLGDEIGDQILSGAISFEDARSMTAAAAAQSRSLAGAAEERTSKGAIRRLEFNLEQEHNL